MLDFIFEIVFRVFIVRIVGVYSRYFFFKILGKYKTIKYLTGEKDKSGGFSQDFINAIVGIFITILVLVLLAYLIYS